MFNFNLKQIMARNYDRLIRFYDSWFDDLISMDKEFSADEILKVIMAIRECQRSASTSPLDELPREIKRGLSMATLHEQISRIIDRVENVRAKGRRGAEERLKEKSEAEKQVIAANQSKANETMAKEEEERNFFVMVKKKFGLSSYDLYALKDGKEKILQDIYHEDTLKDVMSYEAWKRYRGFTSINIIE